MKKLLFIVLFVCFFALQWRSSVLADVQNPFNPVTSFEIASLFYKLCDATPNFKKWAENTDTYKETPEFDKKIVLSQEENRLREGFYNLDAKAPINLYFTVTLDQYSVLQRSFFFPNIDSSTYFPYAYAGEEYALFLPGVGRFAQIPISKEIADRIMGEEVSAEFTIIPEKADSKEPLLIHNKDRWVIIGKIAEFKLWNKSKTTLYFSERAPWYQPKNELVDLFKE